MNKVILMGRLTKDVEVKSTSNGIGYCNFTVAVDRRFKDANGNKQADFINCVAWRNTASFIGSYFRKGSSILVEGEITTRSYDDEQGVKKYVTEVTVSNVEFAGSSNNNNSNNAPQATTAPIIENAEIFEPSDDEAELPFEV